MYSVYILHIHRGGGIAITILIANTGQPLYEQITTQIREQVLSGELGGGQQLPSIRALARDLQVSIITTKRAYEELEREGILETVAGKGSFVCSHPPHAVARMRLAEVEVSLRAAAKKAKAVGVGEEEFAALSARAYQKEED